MAFGCPGKSSPPSLNFDSHNPRIPAAPPVQAMTGYRRSAGNENHPATSAAPGMPDKPPRYRSSPRTPSGFEDIPLPRPNTTCWGYLSQGHTHLQTLVEVPIRTIERVSMKADLHALVHSADPRLLSAAEMSQKVREASLTNIPLHGAVSTLAAALAETMAQDRSLFTNEPRLQERAHQYPLNSK